MSSKKKMVVIAPFWGNSRFIGVFRISGFIRWLSTQQITTILVRAGGSDRSVNTSWGVEITIADPLGLHGDVEEGRGYQFTSRRRPNRLRRLAAHLLLIPDPGVVWARRAARHPLVVKHATSATWVLSSNPPESSHVGSYLLANRLHSRLIIDMRDGWLDEPLRPMLYQSSIQRWREGRWEEKIIRAADHVFVSSPAWKELMERRLPFTKGKITVLYNVCPLPSSNGRISTALAHRPAGLDLVHAGRFTGSRRTRRPGFLLEPFLEGVRTTSMKGKLTFIGSLEPQDRDDLQGYRRRLEDKGWEIVIEPAVSREALSSRLSLADGLLLLTVVPPTIPLKFYDYLVARKPVLAVTPDGSAVWQAASGLSQFFLVDPWLTPRSTTAVISFLEACTAGNWPSEVPSLFTEERLSAVFLETIMRVKP